MDLTLELLRWLNLVIWIGLFLYMVPAARVAIIGKDTRRGDPMRLGVAFICLVMIGGNLRWLFAPDSKSLLAVIHVFAAAAGLYTARLANAYGRGPRI